VCYDKEGSDALPIHSQAKRGTSGCATTAPEDCGYGLQSLSFHEESALVPEGATGRREGGRSGYIWVDGTLYCTLAIDMKVSGKVCY
jgi:hypothetical protein